MPESRCSSPLVFLLLHCLFSLKLPIQFPLFIKVSKNHIGRKRKQPVSSSGPANSSGTANTAGPCPSSPSTPSTHTPGDSMSMPTLPQNIGTSKSLLMFSSDGLGPLTSAPTNLVCDVFLIYFLFLLVSTFMT